MKRPAKLVFAAVLTSIAAATTSSTIAAEGEAAPQDLVQVRASNLVMAASWTRRPDSYVLQVVLDRSKSTGKRPAPSTEPVAAVTTAPTSSIETSSNQDRASIFISSTVANLRGMDPWIPCGRTLTLIDGRRVSGQPPAPPPPDPSLSFLNQPYPPQFKDRHVDVWLLKADGTQLLPATYSCDAGPVLRPKRPSPPVEISYEFPIASGEQAVAAAIRIGDDYYIEKLQAPATKPAVR